MLESMHIVIFYTKKKKVNHGLFSQNVISRNNKNPPKGRKQKGVQKKTLKISHVVRHPKYIEWPILKNQA